MKPSHDSYGAIFGECNCRRCRPAAPRDEPDELPPDEALEWSGINLEDV